jgi:hypothetical protein
MLSAVGKCAGLEIRLLRDSCDRFGGVSLGLSGQGKSKPESTRATRFQPRIAARSNRAQGFWPRIVGYSRPFRRSGQPKLPGSPVLGDLSGLGTAMLRFEKLVLPISGISSDLFSKTCNVFGRKGRMPHTFVGFECVGDHGPIRGDLGETGRTTIHSHSSQRQE